jgi:hypothetical protein
MAHAQKPDFVLLRLKCDGTCAETRFRLTAFEMRWHMRRNQILSYCVSNVMAHSQKPDFVFQKNGRVHLNRLGASVQSTTGSRGVRIGGSNAGYTIFRGSVKSTGYQLHLPVFPFTSPPVRQRVPSHFKWSLQRAQQTHTHMNVSSQKRKDMLQR